jgi:excisionase family DNA binding protein
MTSADMPITHAALDERDVLLTGWEAARYLRRSKPTLERWLREGTGPRSVLVGGRRLYPLTALREFTGAGRAA